MYSEGAQKGMVRLLIGMAALSLLAFAYLLTEELLMPFPMQWTAVFLVIPALIGLGFVMAALRARKGRSPWLFIIINTAVIVAVILWALMNLGTF